MDQIELGFVDKHLEEVSSRIGARVLAFIESVGVGGKFYAANLCEYVWREHMCAPESPGRVMRQLRIAGYFDYEVIDRSRAHYQVTEVA